MKSIFLSILTIGISFISFSQTYNISTLDGTTQTTCSGSFVDEGGSGGDYIKNKDQSITFCPSTAGDIIRITFTSFDVKQANGPSRTCDDVLDVYQGNAAYFTANAGAPEDRYCGTLTGAQLPVITSSSPDGCITFNFISNNSQQAAGWVANISCITPCVNPTANLTDFTDVNICSNTALNGGIIGDAGNFSVDFDASTSNIGSYIAPTSHSLVSYNWDFGDGTTSVTGTATTNHNYTTPGVYKATVSVVDDNTDINAGGCASTNAILREVTVMPNPALVDLGGSTTCGNCVDLSATATSQTTAEVLPVITVTPTNLPDGNGTCYTSTVDYGGFFPDGATVSAGCYPDLCIDISHSWARDLIITLIAPDGKRVRVYNRQNPIDETVPYFGACTNPIDGDADGCPRTYCISTDGSGTNWTAAGTTSDNPSACAAEATCETGVGGEYYLAGTYNSFDLFSNLNGAPLNGVWSLEVCDNQSLDDGTLHSWTIDFPAACLKTLTEITPDISSIAWTPEAGAPAVGGNTCNSTVVLAPGPDACPPGETCPGNELDCDANVCVPAGVSGNFVYDYLVTDEFGCQYDGDVTLSASCACAATATLSIVGNDTFCLGDSTEIIFNFSGTGPYNVTYTDGITNYIESNIADGTTFFVAPSSSTTYSIVSFTDVGLGCNGTFSGTVDIVVNSLPVVVANASANEICIGDSVSLTGSGANNYTWDNGVLDGDSVSPLAQTIYTVTGTNVNGCIDTNSVTIDVNSLPVVTANASSTEICIGDSVQLTGGGASTYTWYNSVIDGDSVGPLTQTTYTVLGRDLNGCVDTNSVTIDVNNLPSIVANASSTTICVGDSVDLTGSGGLSYLWDNGVTDGDSVGPLVQTTYLVTGTDLNGCVDTNSVTIDINALPAIVANASSTTICVGDSVDLTGSGGLSYLWDNGVTDGDSVGPLVQTTYLVTGTDLNGCIDTNSVTIDVNDLPSIVANASSTTICIGDSVDLTGSGGLSYVWDNGVTDGDSVGPLVQTTYLVTGTDLNGCVDTNSVTINLNPTDDANFAYSTNTFCLTGTDPDTISTGTSGGIFSETGGLIIDPNTGTIDLSASGLGNYTVSYTTGGVCPTSTTQNINITNAPNATISYNHPYCPIGSDTVLFGIGASGGTFTSTFGLNINSSTGLIDLLNSTPGTYVVTNTILASGGCAAADDTANVLINALPSIVANASSTTICVGDSVDLTGSGGLSYLWDNGVTDGDSVGPLVQTTYLVTGTDLNGCIDTNSVTIDVNDLPSIVANASSTTICVGDSVDLTGSGGLSYVWDNGVTDGDSVGPLVQTTYLVTGTDLNGCIDTNSVTIDVNDLPSIVANASSTTICIGDSVDLTGSGGLSYVWDNGVTDGDSVGPLVQTTYLVTGTDLNGCADTNSITIDINALPSIVANASSTTICIGDSVDLTGSGGLSYVWDNGVTDGDSVGPLVATTYLVTGTDLNGCFDTNSVTININSTEDANFDYGSTTFCITGSNPDTISTGTSGGIFSQTGGLVINPSTGTIDLLGSGTGNYFVTYTTQGACSEDSVKSITIIDSLNATISYDDPYCKIGNAAVDFEGVGSAGFFSSSAGLILNNSTGGVDLLNSTAGDYIVTNTLVAINGCASASDTAMISINNFDDASFNYPAGPYCQAIGTLDTTLVGTQGGVFTGNNGLIIDASSGSIDLNGNMPDTYLVTYTTNGNCPSSSDVSITITGVDDATFNLTDYCVGSSNNADGVIVPGGVFSFTTPVSDGAIINGSTAEITNGVVGTTYDVTYTTNGTCPNSSSNTVTVINLADASFTMADICEGNNVLTDSIATNNGVFNFLTNQLDGSLIDTLTGTVSNGVRGTTYSIIYTVGNGNCENTDTVDVFVDGAVAAFTPTPITGESPLTVSFSNNSELGFSYLWEFGNGDSSSVFEPTYTYSEEGKYKIILYVYSEELGCMDSTSFEPIVVDNICNMFIPTAFTPEGDGTNDTWIIDCFKELEGGTVVVYNRWGTKVYESSSGLEHIPWDGTGLGGNDLPVGSYFYVVSFDDETDNGSVTIIR